MRLHIIRRCTSFAFPFGAALLLTSSIATSQTQDQGETKAVEASAPSARAPLSIPLSGLTKDNASKVKAAIEKISHTSYKCSSCNTTKKKKGQCCNMEMKAEQHTVAANVVTKLDGETISLTIKKGEMLSLTEVERALGASGARVERNEIPIANFVQLTFKGPKNKEDAGLLEESLKEGDIFKTFDFKFDEGSKNVIVLSTTGAQGATYGKVAQVLEKADGKPRLTDVTWVAPCSACQRKGLKQAGCSVCWKDEGAD